ncbi:MAG TPA: hypothetical protein VG223_13825 [Solirubrobacteraceae bacterium]|jgi:hypothetical protein|nr:hypothetical protein [Solirubrobacteraceae bacterium]
MRDWNITFAIAVPDGWQGLDLIGPDAERYLDRPLARALAQAAHGAEHADLLMLRGLIARVPGGRPLSAGLAVTLADPIAPVSSAPLTAASFDGHDVAAVALPAGSGLRVRYVEPAEVLAGGGLHDVLHLQYLLHSELGLLTITFTTLQAPDAPEWGQFFDALAATAEVA